MKLYFLSLYYKNGVVTGANKRFDETGRRLFLRLNADFICIVASGERPDWCPEENCLEFSYRSSKWSRISAWLQLSYFFARIDRSIIISDFVPIPLSCFRHRFFQLIHDLRNFGEFKRGGLGVFTSWFQRINLRLSANVITVSEFSKEQLRSYCGLKENDVFVSYNGVESFNSYKAVSRDIDVLYVATFEERKNHIRLVHALSKIELNLKVTFVGRDLGKLIHVKNTAKENGLNVEFVESLDEESLTKLYFRSNLYVFPSLYEGFGMPLVEAMGAGCKVVCSDIPVFHEISRDEVVYCNPSSIDSIKQAILFSLFDKSRPSYEKAALNRFCWDSITDDLLMHVIGEPS